MFSSDVPTIIRNDDVSCIKHTNPSPGAEEARVIRGSSSQADRRHGGQHPGPRHRQPPAGAPGGGAGDLRRPARALHRPRLPADDGVQAQHQPGNIHLLLILRARRDLFLNFCLPQYVLF